MLELAVPVAEKFTVKGALVSSREKRYTRFAGPLSDTEVPPFNATLTFPTTAGGNAKQAENSEVLPLTSVAVAVITSPGLSESGYHS